MTLDEEIELIAKKIKHFIVSNRVEYGEIKIVIKDNQLRKLTVAKDEILFN